jgi:hypothetical protein
MFYRNRRRLYNINGDFTVVGDIVYLTVYRILLSLDIDQYNYKKNIGASRNMVADLLYFCASRCLCHEQTKIQRR